MAVPKARAERPASKYDFLCSFAASVTIVDFLDKDLLKVVLLDKAVPGVVGDMASTSFVGLSGGEVGLIKKLAAVILEAFDDVLPSPPIPGNLTELILDAVD